MVPVVRAAWAAMALTGLTRRTSVEPEAQAAQEVTQAPVVLPVPAPATPAALAGKGTVVPGAPAASAARAVTVIWRILVSQTALLVVSAGPVELVVSPPAGAATGMAARAAVAVSVATVIPGRRNLGWPEAKAVPPVPEVPGAKAALRVRARPPAAVVRAAPVVGVALAGPAVETPVPADLMAVPAEPAAAQVQAV